MKITNIESFLVDAGWRPWAFVKISTDEGIVGYGEASCFFTQNSVLGAIEDMKAILIGTDPRAFEVRFWEMYRASRLGSIGGAVGKAIGALECALVDIAARATGQSVAEFFGGPLRTEVPLYWSHCITNRIVGGQFIGSKPIRSMADVAEAASEVTERGFKALKTNILTPGNPALVDHSGFGGGPGSTDQVVTLEIVKQTVELIGTIRETVGPDVEIILDLNFNCKPEGAARIARALEPYNLSWIEIDFMGPGPLRQLRDAVNTPICSSEVMFYMEQHLPFLEARAQDIVMIDVPWNGFVQAKKIGDLAQVYQLNVCPHNYYSHLSSFISANLAAVLPNVQIMEYDVDDVPWKDDFVTTPPTIEDGCMLVPDGPGWGTTLNEDELAARRWGGNARTSVSVPAGGATFDGFNETIMTLYGRGRTVSQIQSHIQDTHSIEVSGNFVASVLGQVFQQVQTWQSRSLEKSYVVVYIDSVVVPLNLQEIGGARNETAFVAIGVLGDGSKEVLGLWVTELESQEFWTSVVSQLRGRGLRDILLLCSDTRVGLSEALEEVLGHKVFQTRVVHMVRSSVGFVERNERRAMFDDLRDIYTASDSGAAESQFERFVDIWGSRFPIIPPLWDGRWSEIVELLELPVELRKAIGTTRATEPLNRQIKNVIKSHGTLSDEQAARRLIYIAIHNATQDWGGKDAGWGPAIEQCADFFGNRMPRKL